MLIQTNNVITIICVQTKAGDELIQNKLMSTSQI